MATTIGIDVGGTKVLAVRMKNNEVVDEARVPTSSEGGWIGADAVDVARAVWSKDVSAVGIGVAGLIRHPDGEFLWGPHLAGTRVPVRAEIAAALDLPVVVDNDANTAAWAEYRLGAGRGARVMVLVTVGTGLGGAIVIDGEIFRGASFAGEFGHMGYETDGRQCDCGRRGCWETVASGSALIRLATERVGSDPSGPLARVFGEGAITGEMVTAAADAGIEDARDLVARVGSALGDGICSLVAILDPDVVVVGGGLGSIGEAILEPARRAVADRLPGAAYRSLPSIVVAELGPAAGAIGAALLADDLVTRQVPLEEVGT